MTLLTQVQSAMDRLSLPRTTVAFTATDLTVRNILALAQQEGRELARFGPWQQLRKEHTFSTVATEAQSSSIPTDFGMYCNDTAWNRTRKQQLIGPLDPMSWQRIVAMTTSPAVDTFTIRANGIRILPVPPASQTIAYEYISNNWCESSGGTDQNAWAADTDVGLLSEELMSLGIIWRYKKGRGMAWDVEYAEYQDQRAEFLGNSTMRQIVNMAGGVWRIPPSGIIAPDGDWAP